MSQKHGTVDAMGLLDVNVPRQTSFDFFAESRRVNIDELTNAELIAYAQAQAICALAAKACGISHTRPAPIALLREIRCDRIRSQASPCGGRTAAA